MAYIKWLEWYYAHQQPVKPIPQYSYRVRTSKQITLDDFSSYFAHPERIEVVDAEKLIYDVVCTKETVNHTFYSCDWLLEVIGANIVGATNISGAFQLCLNLVSVAVFDTSGIENMSMLFSECSSLTKIPLINTSSVTTMDYICEKCTKAESGGYALYKQASEQTVPPESHTDAFAGYGSETESGTRELNQIPTSWGGLLDDDNILIDDEGDELSDDYGDILEFNEI